MDARRREEHFAWEIFIISCKNTYDVCLICRYNHYKISKLSVFVHWCVSNVPFDLKIVVSSVFLQHVAIFVLQDAPIRMQYILLDLRM